MAAAGPTYTDIGLISREPVLAKILASRRPLLIGQEGYNYIVSMIATVGTILRSREHLIGLIVGTIDSMALSAVFSVLSKTALGEFLARSMRW